MNIIGIFLDKLFVLSSILVFVYILQQLWNIYTSMFSPIAIFMGIVVYILYMYIVYCMSTSSRVLIKCLGYGSSVAPILFLLENEYVKL